MIHLAAIYWDSNPEIFRVPYFDWPILWYGVLFALSFAIGFPIFIGILTRFLGKEHRKKAIHLTDKLTLYIILGTVIGARLGHFIFYERPEKYLLNPLEIFRIWGGGLASHGGAIGIILALIIFSAKIRKKNPSLNWVRLLDFICVPAALAGCFIRIGNFINQEILGKVTDVPWAVVFGHPADRSFPVPRHPVVLYESCFYLLVFFVLWKLSFKKSNLQSQGKLIGLFLMLVFGFRFFIEYFKPEQSHLLMNSFLTMGQFLSIPAVILGLFFFLRSKKKNGHALQN